MKKRIFFDLEVEKSIADNFADKCRRQEISMKDRVVALIEQDVVEFLSD